MDRIREKAFFVTIAVLIALEIVSWLAYRRSWARDFTPLGWTAIVRGIDVLLFFVLFKTLSVPVSTAGLKGFFKGAFVGLAATLILGSGCFLILYLVRALWGIDLRAFVNPGAEVRGLAPLAIVCLLGPFAEEIFFRGLCYTVIRPHTGVWIAVLLSACFFGASHLLSTGAIGVLIVPVLGGVVLALLYEFVGSLLAPLILHALANFILFSRII